MVFRAVSYDHTPKSTKNLLDFRNTKYDLREPTFEKLPKVNTTTYGLKSWRYRAPQLWNLPLESHRTVRTTKTFKDSIKNIEFLGLLPNILVYMTIVFTSLHKVELLQIAFYCPDSNLFKMLKFLFICHIICFFNLILIYVEDL